MNRSSFFGIVLAATLGFGLCAPPPSQAVLIVGEAFSYPDGPLHGKGGATAGFAGPWTAFSQFGVAAGAMNYQPTAPFSFDLASRPIAGGAPVPDDGESLYAAFDMKISPLADGKLERFVVTLAASGAGDSWTFGVSGSMFTLNGGGDGGSVDPNVTYRLVTRLTRIDSGNDIINLWIDPSAETDTPLLTSSTPTFSAARSSLTDLGSFGFDSFSLDAGTIDDIAVGTSFDDVSGAPVPIPEPAALFALGVAVTIARLRRRR